MEGFDENAAILKDYNNSNTLLVTFGGIKKGVGIPIFEFRRILNEFPCDKLFLRDLHQTWYHKGLNSEINSISSIEDYLEILITSRDYKNVVFLGNSMGGYAAILLGTLLNVNQIIAFSPQSFVDKFNRFLHRDKRWAQQIKSLHNLNNVNKKHLDLKYLLNKHKGSVVPTDIYYSTLHKLDRKHAERLGQFKNIRLIPYKNNGHNLVKQLRDEQKLSLIIKNAIT